MKTIYSDIISKDLHNKTEVLMALESFLNQYQIKGIIFVDDEDINVQTWAIGEFGEYLCETFSSDERYEGKI